MVEINATFKDLKDAGVVVPISLLVRLALIETGWVLEND